MLDEWWTIPASLPLHSLYSGPRRIRLEQEWVCAHAGVPLPAVLSILVLLAVLLPILPLLLGLALLNDVISALGLAFICFALVLLSGYYLPRHMASRFSRVLEADLPLVLRAMALHLSIKLPFESALAHAASGNYASAPLWREVLSSAESGESVPRALSNAAGRVESLHFARAVHALSTLYEEGGSPDTLVALADDLTSQQMAEARTQASRAAMGGLLYVAVSSLLPAFFLILALAAGPLLGFRPTPMAVGLFYAVGLPVLTALALFFMLSASPVMAGTYRWQALRDEVASRFSRHGLPAPTPSLMAVLSLSIGLFGLAVSVLLSFHPLVLLLALLSALLPLLLYSLLEGQALAESASADSQLPQLLLSGASAGRFSLEKMLEQAASGPSGPLAVQSASALRQLRAGTPPPAVLAQWSERTPSILLARVLSLLAVGYRTGGQMHRALRAAAQDLMASFHLHSERAALLSTQRYTLMAAAGLLVPAILAVSLSFVSQLSALQSALPAGETAGGLLSSLLPGSSRELLSAASGSITLYLLINAILTGFFVSILQGARERFVLNAALLALLSQAVWMALAPGL